eukprot:SAG11_NODE_29722_length_308_cov_0.478469_1_plen_82_part_10
MITMKNARVGCRSAGVVVEVDFLDVRDLCAPLRWLRVVGGVDVQLCWASPVTLHESKKSLQILDLISEAGKCLGRGKHPQR